MTQYQYKIYKYTITTNRLLKDGAALNFLLKNRRPGVLLALFDVHQLIKDIHANHTEYLTAPHEVTKVLFGCGIWVPAFGLSLVRQKFI